MPASRTDRDLGVGEEQLHVVVRRGAHVLLSPTDEELSAVVGEVADGGSRDPPVRR